MLHLQIKNTLRRHGISMLAVLLLMIFAVLSVNFSVFRFAAMREKLITTTASTYTVRMHQAYDDSLRKQCEQVREVLGGGIKTMDATAGTALPVSVLWDEADEFFYFGTMGALPQLPNTIAIGRETRAAGVEIGDTVERFGKTYTVCGVNPGVQYDYLPVENLPTGVEITELHVVCGAAFSVRESGEIVAQLRAIFPDGEVEKPEDVDLLEGMLFQLRSAILIATLAVVNIVFVFSFLLDKQKFAFRIFRICGLRRSRLAAALLAEVVVLALLGTAVGNLLFFIGFGNTITPLRAWWLIGALTASGICLGVCLLFTVPKILYFAFRRLRMEEVWYD